MPYRTDKAYNALRLADTASSKDVKVVVFLMGDAVYVARKHQQPPSNLPNLEQMVTNLISKGVEFKLCTTCVNARGFEPKEGEIASCFLGTKKEGSLSPADLVSGSQMSSMVELTNLIANSDKIVSF
jgi:uncharacterized protein involved in oxidation of intracellular sulfur